MRIAVIPDDKMEKQIAGLAIGESAWTVPWAIELDAGQRAFLNTHFSQHENPGGTVQLKVTRERDGWKAELYDREYKFNRGDGNVGLHCEPITSIKC